MLRQAGAKINIKISALPGIREWGEGMPVELWLNEEGRIVLKAWNEAGHNSTQIDVFDFLEWLNVGTGSLSGLQGVGTSENANAARSVN